MFGRKAIKDVPANPMQLIRDNVTFTAMIPWNGTPIPCELYMLNAVQIKSCGDFNIIDIDQKAESKELDIDDIIGVKNSQEKLIKYALIHPTFDEILDHLGQTEVYTRVKEQIATIEGKLKELSDIKDDAYKMLEDQLEQSKLFVGLPLPDDFMAVITALILQRDASDIHRVTREMLLEAAFLAEKWHDRPADHVSGVFTKFQSEHVNKMAAIVLHEYRENQEVEKNTGKRWFRGGVQEA